MLIMTHNINMLYIRIGCASQSRAQLWVDVCTKDVSAPFCNNYHETVRTCVTY